MRQPICDVKQAIRTIFIVIAVGLVRQHLKCSTEILIEYHTEGFDRGIDGYKAPGAMSGR